MDGKATYTKYSNCVKMSKYKLFANLQSLSQLDLSFFWALNALRTQKHLVCLQHSKLENLVSDKPQTRTFIQLADWITQSLSVCQTLSESIFRCITIDNTSTYLMAAFKLKMLLPLNMQHLQFCTDLDTPHAAWSWLHPQMHCHSDTCTQKKPYDFCAC